MIVDDNPNTISLMSKVIRYLGHEPMGAHEWLEAETRLLHDLPDLLFVDLRMPGIDGFQAIRRARAMPQTEGLPIVVLTASPAADVKLEIQQAGANAVYSKPISLTEMDSAIRWFTNGWRETHKPDHFAASGGTFPEDQAA
jgi:two-component system alkaline phosphatase synthesis response regulator PhoP